MSHIHHSLKRLDGKFTVTKEAGRIYATAAEEFDYDEVIDALKKVFGIAAICPMVQLEDNGYDDLKAKIVEYVDKAYPDKHFTFKVNTRRANKQYPHTSEEVNRDLGEVILDAFPETKVDVHNPDVLLNVELRGTTCASYPFGNSMATPSGINLNSPAFNSTVSLARRSIQSDFPSIYSSLSNFILVKIICIRIVFLFLFYLPPIF